MIEMRNDDLIDVVLREGLLDLLGKYPEAPARLAMSYGLNGWLVRE